MTTTELDRAAKAASVLGVPRGGSGESTQVKHVVFDRTGQAQKPGTALSFGTPSGGQGPGGNQITIMLRVGHRLPTRLAVAARVA
jgi:hypothetical protein